MLSESARAASKQETRFRVPYPNSRPRTARLVALDRPAEPFVAHMTKGRPQRRHMPLWSDWEQDGDAGQAAANARLGRDASARAGLLVTELDSTDLVVMVSLAGDDNPAASVIAEACRLRRVPVIVFVLEHEGRPADELAETLEHLRPYATMLVRAPDEAYVDDMLRALRV